MERIVLRHLMLEGKQVEEFRCHISENLSSDAIFSIGQI